MSDYFFSFELLVLPKVVPRLDWTFQLCNLMDLANEENQ